MQEIRSVPGLGTFRPGPHFAFGGGPLKGLRLGFSCYDELALEDMDWRMVEARLGIP